MSSEEYNLINVKLILSQRIHIQNVDIRCGLKVGLNDDGVTREMIPTHVYEAERTNKASQGRLVLPPKGFWISKTNIFAPALFFCVVTKYVTVLFWKVSIL